MNHTERRTYGDLISILQQMDFQEESVPGSHQAFRHSVTGTLILFADAGPEEPARLEDLISVRRQLDAKGLMEASEFDRRFPQLAEFELPRSQDAEGHSKPHPA